MEELLNKKVKIYMKKVGYPAETLKGVILKLVEIGKDEVFIQLDNNIFINVKYIETIEMIEK